MKRPSEYMTMTDGVTQQDYKNALNKYIDYLETKIKALSQHDVSGRSEQLFCKECGGKMVWNSLIDKTECEDCGCDLAK